VTLLNCDLITTNQQIYSHPYPLSPPPPFKRQLIIHSSISGHFGNFLRRLAFALASTFLYAYGAVSFTDKRWEGLCGWSQRYRGYDVVNTSGRCVKLLKMLWKVVRRCCNYLDNRVLRDIRRVLVQIRNRIMDKSFLWKHKRWHSMSSLTRNFSLWFVPAIF